MGSYIMLTTIILLGSLTFASGSNCRFSDTGSCWVAINHSNQKAELSCTAQQHDGFVASLKGNGDSVSHQFDRSWGDGLGYPEPGIHYVCSLSLDQAIAATVEFSTLSWGDHVTFEINPNELVVHQKCTWTPCENTIRKKIN